MATSGRRTMRQQASADILQRRVWVLRAWLHSLGGVAAILFLLGACSTSFRGGSPPPIDRLAGLTVGVSTASDIIAALGNPPGHGGVGLPDAPRQDMWVYESHEIQGSASHQNMLFVFVDRQSGVFNGYMWFRGGSLLSQTK